MTDCLLGVTSFFTIALGGLSVGMIHGLLTALITKYTKEVRVVEPLAILIMAYLGYMVAEVFHWSGMDRCPPLRLLYPKSGLLE